MAVLQNKLHASKRNDVGFGPGHANQQSMFVPQIWSHIYEEISPLFLTFSMPCIHYKALTYKLEFLSTRGQYIGIHNKIYC